MRSAILSQNFGALQVWKRSTIPSDIVKCVASSPTRRYIFFSRSRRICRVITNLNGKFTLLNSMKGRLVLELTMVSANRYLVH